MAGNPGDESSRGPTPPSLGDSTTPGGVAQGKWQRLRRFFVRMLKSFLHRNPAPVDGPAPPKPSPESARTTQPPSVAPAVAPPGTRIGKYEIIAELGRGGMGVVYKARDPFLGRLVTLKTLAPKAASDPEIRKRFYREAQAPATLHHPNIIEIYDWGEADGRPYLAMEFFEGEGLQQLINRRARIPLAAKLQLLQQLCEGLSHAHQHGVVHRDVKPANILVTNEGIVKLVDFGIVHLETINLPKTGLFLGTIHYASPELINNGRVDIRSDIWSVACVVYELIAYKKAFDAPGISGIIAKVLSTEPEPLSRCCPGVPAELDAVISKGLKKNVDERYQSLEEMLGDLNPIARSVQLNLINDLLQEAKDLQDKGDLNSAQEKVRAILILDDTHEEAKRLFSEVSLELERPTQQPSVAPVVAPPGTRIGKYEILAELGQGSMGVVYKARDPFLGRIVALKTLTPELASDPEILRRFYLGAQAPAALDHPNIMVIRDFGEADGRPYVAMEFVEGESLQSIINRRARIPLAAKLRLVQQTCEGLDHAHKHGLVLRNVKPANILVTTDGIVKVVGFEIVLSESAELPLTKTGMILGTIHHPSPEQIKHGRVDSRCDIWSVACVMYELIAYQKPFDGSNIAAIVAQVLSAEPEPLSRCCPGVPAELDAVISKGLKKNPDERYQSLDEMLGDLLPIARSVQQNFINDLLQEAKDLRDKGDLNVAQEKVRAVLHIDSAHEEAKRLGSEISLELGRIPPSKP